MTDAQAFANSVEAGSMDEATVKAKLGELFNAAMAKTADMTDNYVSLDLTKGRHVDPDRRTRGATRWVSDGCDLTSSVRTGCHPAASHTDNRAFAARFSMLG